VPLASNADRMKNDLSMLVISKKLQYAARKPQPREEVLTWHLASVFLQRVREVCYFH
jgi:hypothetical protein